MKIGEFAKRNNFTKDTIRYYIDLGLLFPLKKGSHYHFDDKTEQELKDIVSFKSMGFSLNEIKKILEFKRIGRLTHYQAAEYYNQFFKNKYQAIEEEIKLLEQTRNQLKTKIDELSSYKPQEPFKLGIDLSVLSKLVCPKCKGQSPLTLTSGNISDNQILDGELSCTCGKVYQIHDGILCVKQSIKNQVELLDESLLVNYIRETPSNYIDHLYKGGVWLERNIACELLEQSTVLELGVGFGHFLRFIYNEMPDSTVYFAVDHNLETLTVLKRLLERADVKKQIIFICSDFLEIPLADQSVDTVVDFAGSSNYAFSHEHFLLNEVESIFKKNATLIGSYIIFNKFSRNSHIPSHLREHFKIGPITERIKNLQFRIKTDMSTDLLTDGGKYESYITEGEEVYSYYMMGVRE